MEYHILNGDGLLPVFNAAGFRGETIICRECLIEGPLKEDNLSKFWEDRSLFIRDTYHENKENYYKKVVEEFEKIIAIPDNSEINLWFEHDLYCQVNLWFILSLLKNKNGKQKVFIVYPHIAKKEDLWKGFGMSGSEELKQAYIDRIELSSSDIELGNDLWKAYKSEFLIRLEELSRVNSPCFPHLQKVCLAHIERLIIRRPEEIMEDIITNKTTDFEQAYNEFFKREGVYGFSDLQVRRMFDKLIF